jgi:hypothetical protein
MTAWLHRNPLKARSIPATNPEIMQIAFSQRRSNPFSSAIPSIIMLLPRDTINASKPQASAHEAADIKATRNAMLENGINTVKSQDKIVQTGYPGGCGTPA